MKYWGLWSLDCEYWVPLSLSGAKENGEKKSLTPRISHGHFIFLARRPSESERGTSRGDTRGLYYLLFWIHFFRYLPYQYFELLFFDGVDLTLRESFNEGITTKAKRLEARVVPKLLKALDKITLNTIEIWAISEFLLPLFQNESSFKLFLRRWFTWKWNCSVSKFSCDFALGLVFKQRQKATRKWLIQRMHMTSWQPYWRPCWWTKPFLWEFNSFLT